MLISSNVYFPPCSHTWYSPVESIHPLSFRTLTQKEQLLQNLFLAFSGDYWSLFSYVPLSICKVTTLVALKYTQKILLLYSSAQSAFLLFLCISCYIPPVHLCYAISRHLIFAWLRWTQELFLCTYNGFFSWSNCFMSKLKVIYFQQIRLLKWILNKHL